MSTDNKSAKSKFHLSRSLPILKLPDINTKKKSLGDVFNVPDSILLRGFTLADLRKGQLALEQTKSRKTTVDDLELNKKIHIVNNRTLPRPLDTLPLQNLSSSMDLKILLLERAGKNDIIKPGNIPRNLIVNE